MELFRNLRVKASRSMLAGKVARIKRKPSYINFYSIKSIGIVWDASKTEDFIKLSGFYQRMAEKNIEVKIFGYFPGNELPNQYTAIRYLYCLKRQEVDFFYKPTTQDAAAFSGRSFDVLIDINFNKLLPLCYISSLSQAALKVGLADADPGSSPFDLMISLKNPVTVDRYLEQVLCYLEMINSQTEKKAV